MKKSIIVITAILVMVLACSFILTACVSTSMKSTVNSIEKKGYSVSSTDYQNKDENANYYSATYDWTVVATPNSNGNFLDSISDLTKSVHIACYYKSDVAKTDYENSSLPTYKEAGDNDVCKLLKGRVLITGVKKTVKDVK